MKHISELAILVVDDQPIIDEFCRKILEQLGCKWVYSALSGRDAAKLLAERGDINLVLTDINMQPGNGLELLQAIRCGDVDRTPRDLCVLVVTDYNDRHNVMKAVGLDCHGFLSKPFNAALLADKIQAALHRQITLAPVETYRRIPTDISQTAPPIIPPGGIPITPERQPLPDANPTSATLETAITRPPQAPAESDEYSLEIALDALLPAGAHDDFLIQRQADIRAILQLLSRIGQELNALPESELLHLVNQLEEMSSTAFQQEFEHQHKHRYDALSAHQAEHGLILQRTQMLAGKLHNHHQSHAFKAYQQLRQTWYRHISSKDHRYVEFLKERGIA